MTLNIKLNKVRNYDACLFNVPTYKIQYKTNGSTILFDLTDSKINNDFWFERNMIFLFLSNDKIIKKYALFMISIK